MMDNETRQKNLIERTKSFEYNIIVFNNTVEGKTSNIGNYLNNVAIKELIKDDPRFNIIEFHDKDKIFKENAIYSPKEFKLVSNPIFFAECITEDPSYMSNINTYKTFLSGFSDKVDYSKCLLKCFRFKEFNKEIMPDITVILHNSLKKYARGFNKEITIDYLRNVYIINGIKQSARPMRLAPPDAKLKLIGEAKYLKSNSLHCLLIGLMIGVPVVEVISRKNVKKIYQLRDWLSGLGFEVNGNVINNKIDFDWESQAKIVYNAFNYIFNQNDK